MQSMNAPRGSITLTAVFLTTFMIFLFVFSDHVKAIKENTIAGNDAATEQAFYAAQSCVEEGYWQLRTDAQYVSVYTGGQPLSVGNGTCTLTVEPNPGDPASGRLLGRGTNRAQVRTVQSRYHDAGPTTMRTDTSIMHVVDISTSMSQGTKLPDAKTAAARFLDNLDPAHDEIGLASFNRAAYVNHPITAEYPSVASSINALTIGLSGTNIGEGIRVAATTLDQRPSARTRVLILLTDGQASWYGNPPQQGFTAGRQYAVQQATIAKAAPYNVLIVAIGLGDPGEFDEPFLRDEIASPGGPHPHGKLYWHAPDSSDLQRIYEEIWDALTEFRIGQGTWSEQ